MGSPRNIYRLAVAVGMLFGLATSVAVAEEDSLLDRVLDQIVANEQALAEEMKQFSPLVETYVQSVAPDADQGTVPKRDHYFLGRLGVNQAAESASDKKRSRPGEQLVDMFSGFYADSFRPDGFARMLVLDANSFDRENYRFEFVRNEFVGEIRTLVFEVVPTLTDRPHRFIGRIWVDDEGYKIIRYNGVYSAKGEPNLHFDSWRLNLQPDKWYPAYVYTEESVFKNKGRYKYKHKGQTRIWGYQIEGQNSEDEFTKVMFEAAKTDDRSEAPGNISPVESLRAWEREAEDNVLRRLEKSGLLAPTGEVDGVLQTVVENLEVTNDLNIQPPVRCRVLMTTPLESFTVGHTIVVSRGLIDVLPDEASLAMVLAHELGHILEGNQLDTKYAFSDQMLVGDKQTLEKFHFKSTTQEEQAADERAMGLLATSPYADMGNAGLFLKALAARSGVLPALIRSHFGNGLARRDRMARMNAVVQQSPDLDPSALDQIAALPLGGRVQVDPWTAEISLMKNTRVALVSAREKLPFAVTPMMPHLVRFDVTQGSGQAHEAEPADPADTAVEPAVDTVARNEQE